MTFFDYDLPPELIAQHPTKKRDQSRLMHVVRSTRQMTHRLFHELPELLRPGDLLVLNNTRVLAARLIGKRERTGGKWEGLFLSELPGGVWEMMCQTRHSPKPGDFILVDPGPLRLELIEKTPEGHWRLRPDPPGSAIELLTRFGRTPLPRYIRKGVERLEDRDRYQTVFASRLGAIAAPTAGLHFTPELFTRLEDRGITKAFVTLHVGEGTFEPIRVTDFRQHKMHAEWGELPAESATAITDCRRRGGRVVAVGTTSARLLETVAATGDIRPWSGMTDLFIHPPHEFGAVDALVTNFHLPQSTLLLLVGAFAGDELLRRAYAEAITQQYRFYSYGDAMLIE